MELYHSITLSNWQLIRDRYQNQLPDVTGERLISLDAIELAWITDQIIEEVNSFIGKTFTVKNAIIFGQGPKNVQGSHVDGFQRGRQGASNWALNIPVLNCDQGEMIWFKGDYILEPAINESNIGYQHINWSNGPHFLASKIIDTPTIVKVDIPHQVINHTNERRLMLSVRFTPDLY